MMFFSSAVFTNLNPNSQKLTQKSLLLGPRLSFTQNASVALNFKNTKELEFRIRVIYVRCRRCVTCFTVEVTCTGIEVDWAAGGRRSGGLCRDHGGTVLPKLVVLFRTH